MASNISVADLMGAMNGSSSSTTPTPTTTPASTDISVDSLLNSLGMTQKQEEGTPTKGVDASIPELAGRGFLYGVERTGAGIQELGRSAFTQATGIDVLTDWKDFRIEREQEFSDWFGKMNEYEHKAFGLGNLTGSTASIMAAVPARTPMAVIAGSTAYGASVPTEDGSLLSMERTMNALYAANGAVIPIGLLNTGKTIIGKVIVDPVVAAMDFFTSKGGAKQAVKGVTPSAVKEATEAASRLGVRITPAEASANQVITSREASSFGGLDPAKALVAQEIRMGRDKELAEVVGGFVRGIIPEGKAAIKKTLEDLYGTAFKVKMSPKFIQKLEDNEIYAAAKKRLLSDPANLIRFKALNENSLGQVELIRREISANAHASATSIDTLQQQKAPALQSINKMIKGFLKNSSPEYSAALPIAQRNIAYKRIKNELGKLKTKASPEGTSVYNATPDQFYDAILATPKKRAELTRQLKDVGGSGQAIEDLAFILARLKNTPFNSLGATGGAKASFATMGLNKAGIAIVNTISYLRGRHNQALIEVVTNGKWQNSLQKVRKIKDPSKQLEALATALAYVTASSLTSAKAQAGNEQRTSAR